MPGAHDTMVKLFFIFIYIWQEDVTKISKAQGAPGNNMVSRRNHLLYYFSIGSIHLHLANFYATKYFWKINYLEETLIEQIIEFELRGPGSTGRTCTSTTGYFHNKTKIFKTNLLLDHYLLLKYC